MRRNILAATVVLAVGAWLSVGGVASAAVTPPIPPQPPTPQELNPTLSTASPLYGATGGKICALTPTVFAIGGLGTALVLATAGGAFAVPQVGGVAPTAELNQSLTNAYAVQLMACGIVPRPAMTTQCELDRQVAAPVPNTPEVTIPLAGSLGTPRGQMPSLTGAGVATVAGVSAPAGDALSTQLTCAQVDSFAGSGIGVNPGGGAVGGTASPAAAGPATAVGAGGSPSSAATGGKTTQASRTPSSLQSLSGNGSSSFAFAPSSSAGAALAAAEFPSVNAIGSDVALGDEDSAGALSPLTPMRLAIALALAAAAVLCFLPGLRDTTK